MTLQESGSAVPRTTSSALTPSSSPPGGRQGRMSSATRGGPVLAAASGSPAGGHKPEPVGAGMSSAEASDHARSRGYERGALSRGGPRSRGHAGGSLTFGISHSAWRTHGLPPHPDPSAPAAAVGHDSRRVVNRCAFAQSAWGPVMATTCRSPPAVRRGRGPVRRRPSPTTTRAPRAARRPASSTVSSSGRR